MKRKLRNTWPLVLGLSMVIFTGCQGQQSSANAAVPINAGSASPNESTSTNVNISANTGASDAPQKAPAEQKPAAEAPTQAAPASVSFGKVTAARVANQHEGWIAGEGWIAKTGDGGYHWSLQHQFKGTAWQLFALNNQRAWATVKGENNGSNQLTLLSTVDGGKHWQESGRVPNQDFLHFVSNQEAYSGRWKTSDGGKSWTKLPVPANVIGEPYFHDKAVGWAVTQENGGFQVKRTGDGGKAWSVVMTKKSVALLNGVLIRSAGTNDAWIECIGDSGMTQTSYALFHTVDGGKSWQTVIAKSTAGAGPAPGFPMEYNNGPDIGGSSPGPLYVVNSRVAFMGARCMACDKPNTIGWTLDGGKTLGKGTISLEGYGEESLAFVDEKYGWWIITDQSDSSMLYTTTDGGKHWGLVHKFDRPKKA